MTKLSNLPRYLVEEVLCKLSLTSLRRVRSTCKKWNNLSKDSSFAKKHLAGQAKVAEKQREFIVVMMMDYRVYLLSVNLHNNDVESLLHFWDLTSAFKYQDALSLSIVREDQLVVLHQPRNALKVEIWVTTKIEPNTVSWNSKVFLEANIKQLIQNRLCFRFTNVSFFIDEEKKVAVVSDKGIRCHKLNNIAYIFGVDGSLEEVDLGESANMRCFPRLYTYVPSLVQL